MLLAGYNGGDWNGLQLTSSAAAAIAADPLQTHKRALGYSEASAIKVTSFDGVTVDNTTLIVAYTFAGDANLDRKVNALDFNALASGFGMAGPDWNNGDFNYD